MGRGEYGSNGVSNHHCHVGWSDEEIAARRRATPKAPWWKIAIGAGVVMAGGYLVFVRPLVKQGRWNEKNRDRVDRFIEAQKHRP